MGQSTNGILAFGWAFDEDEEDSLMPEEAQEYGLRIDEWYDEQLVKLADIGPDPAADAPTDTVGWKAFFAEHEDEVKAYWKAAREAKEAGPIELVRHCSGDYPMWIVSHRHFNSSASRGNPKLVQPVLLMDAKKTVHEMRDWAAKIGMTLPDDEPQWWLASLWS